MTVGHAVAKPMEIGKQNAGLFVCESDDRVLIQRDAAADTIVIRWQQVLQELVVGGKPLHLHIGVGRNVTDAGGHGYYHQIVFHDVVASVIEHETAFTCRTQQMHTGMAELRRVHPVEVGGILEIYLHWDKNTTISANCENIDVFCENKLSKKRLIFALRNKHIIMNPQSILMAIVIFFSHAGDNYSVGNIEVGNTKIVADYITEIIGADQFEIVTHKYDGMPYNPLIKLAKEEAQNGELPPYEGTVPDFAKYDTVFIGGPVWWGTYPQVMFTLFKDINLDGKTVIPFTTHEGSGLANCVEDVKEAFPGANVTKGFAIYGHEVRSGRAKVEKWLNSIVK